jgi:serine protease DegQ
MLRPAARQRAAPLAVLVLVLAACNGDRGDTAAPPEAEEAPEDLAEVSTALDVPELVRDVSPSVVAVVGGEGGGSGIIFDADGLVVTNAHVAEELDAIEVVLGDGDRVPATLVASDPLSDVAVLEVERRGLPAATFPVDLPEVGESVIAVGNPLGLESSVTLGIVSGLQRDLPVPVAAGGQALVDLIQTDAAISPGNSGGALVNAGGEVVGMTVAYIPPQLGAVSLGFAIPSATVVDVATQLIDDGQVSHAYVGIAPAPLTPEMAQQFGLGAERGVLVQEVLPDGPAQGAGVQQGDVVVAIGDDETADLGAFLAAVRRAEPGDEITLAIVRGDEELEIDVVLTERPD